jgi:hypothetical protein
MTGVIPRHLADGEGAHRLYLLQRWANALRGRYGVPVYLCGSALRDDNADPRDWDVRLRIPAARFRAMYGDPAQWCREGDTGQWTRVRWRWSDDCVKVTKEGWKQTRLNIDFQAYPPAMWNKFLDEPRLRLDTRGQRLAIVTSTPTEGPVEE